MRVARVRRRSNVHEFRRKMLETPDLIANLSLGKDPIKFRWDDDAAEELYSKDVPVIERALVPVNLLGRLAFSAACGEWVAARLETRPKRQVLSQVVEAAWAAQSGLGVFETEVDLKELFGNDVRGSETGPLFYTSRVLHDSIKRMQQNKPRLSDVASLHILAEHVLADKKPFRDWRARAVKYLGENSPIIDTDRVGQAIPHQYFWTLKPLDENAKRLVEALVDDARRLGNLFVR
jgi:hypothetical protein